MPSFDVVSELNFHEVDNAITQANRELENRFDFKGSHAKFERTKHELAMESPGEFQLQQMLDIIRLKLAKRGVDLICLDVQEPHVNLARARQIIVLREGIDAASAKTLQRAIKDSKLKVQAAIQGEKLRITGKSRDELQAAIALLRQQSVDVPLQFNNFRE